MSALTNNQIIKLNILCKEAWQAQTNAYATDLNLTDWRHEQVFAAVKKKGLSVCGQRDYRALENHFLTAAGRGNFNKAVLAGKAYRAATEEDTYHARSVQRHLILAALTAHGEAMAELGRTDCITAAYVETIAMSQHKVSYENLNALTLPQLKKLLYTVRNRIAAREGRGERSNRNKKQRSPSKPKTAPALN